MAKLVLTTLLQHVPGIFFRVEDLSPVSFGVGVVVHYWESIWPSPLLLMLLVLVNLLSPFYELCLPFIHHSNIKGSSGNFEVCILSAYCRALASLKAYHKFAVRRTLLPFYLFTNIRSSLSVITLAHLPLSVTAIVPCQCRHIVPHR
jgi:hypothetical protein